MILGMETLSRPVSQRIAIYRSEADRLRQMAEVGRSDTHELLAVARQYQQLADGLKTGAPFSVGINSRSLPF